ncbi:hypothetical protein ACFFGV_00205 [Pontibacillus salicampi]|uniref:Uncharacterized protein n=1 Tax=Pontibacillus salicampi TaxID=1449801 RepID=A0ABV6LHZ8_9BACI
MTISVHYQDTFIGKLNESSLILFRLFCMEKGYRLDWHSGEKRIHIEPPLDSYKVQLDFDETEDAFGKAVASSIKQYVREAGLVIDHNRSSLTPANFHITLEPIKQTTYMKRPNLFIMHNGSTQMMQFIQHLKEQFNLFQLTHSFIKQSSSSTTPPSLIVQCEMPHQDSQTTLKQYTEELAITLASGILHYFATSLGIDIAYFTKEPLLPFLDQKPSRSSASKERPNPSASKKPIKRQQEKAVTMAEVFFDYVLYPSRELKQYMITGDLVIKNTGTVPLRNPVICLKAHPIEQISLGGQILPPAMADIYGVQTDDGIKGWRYVEENWFEKAQERGEYWITTIDESTIKPGEEAVLPSFQLTLKEKENSKEQMIVQSVVYFKQNEASFASNNDIVIAYA